MGRLNCVPLLPSCRNVSEVRHPFTPLQQLIMESHADGAQQMIKARGDFPIAPEFSVAKYRIALRTVTTELSQSSSR